MVKKIKMILAIIVIIAILNILNGCIEENQENSDSTLSNIKIDNLQINPNKTIPNQPILISVDVENLNNSKISESVILEWENGEKLMEDFQLNPFEKKKNNMGNIRI